jgi:predicted DNA-binding transcriptional regulator AlpA
MDIKGHLTSDEAAELLGINRQSLYNLANRMPDFPRPKKIGRTSLWPENGLRKWRAAHPARKRRTD